MTIKNESKNKNNKTSTPKEILYEAVQKNPTRNYIIMGANSSRIIQSVQTRRKYLWC